MRKIILILAYDLDYGIGNKGDLLYSLPSDLKRFKEKTLNQTVVMGRKTWESLPGKLKHRKNVVLSSTPHLEADETYSQLEDLLSLNETLYVIGGASLYKEFLPYADSLEITMIKSRREADTSVDFFKDIDTLFNLEAIETHTELDRISKQEVEFDFLTYNRKEA